MKKIKIFIIPHNPSERHLKFNLSIFLILFLILILSGISVFTFINLSRYIDTSSISIIENDNRNLKKYIAKIESELPLLTQQLDSLRRIQKDIMRRYKFLLDEKKEFNFSRNIDTILSYVLKVDSLFRYASSEILKNKEFFPSIPPVSGRIVRKFGSAYDYLTEKWKPFNGIGIASKSGECVLATAYGIVEKTGYSKEMGNFVTINHNNIYRTTYAHLGKINVRIGQKVKRGETIGNLGKTGKILFPILYYEIKKGEIFLNPEDFIMEEI